MDKRVVVGAFGEEEAAKLSGLTAGQLRLWDRSGFFAPSFAVQEKGLPFNRVYSFRDIVSLRVLGQLRNNLKVPMQELRRVSKAMSDFGDAKWTATTLYVLGKKVVFTDPRTLERKEVVSGQRVFDIPLLVAISDTRRAISKLNTRNSEQAGKFAQGRFVQQNEPVLLGTRIPVAAVARYLEAGFSDAAVLAEYPTLTRSDLAAVRKSLEGESAA